VNDWVIGDISFNRSGENIIVNIPLQYPVTSDIFPLGAPSRLVVDFGRIFSRTEKGGKITDAIEYTRVVKGGTNGYISAQVLKIDPKKNDIFPVLAEPKSTFIGSVVDFLTPWVKKVRKHFYRETVSSMAARSGAAAAVNGTFFSQSGRPLGVLMINGEAVSYPISDRTALIITEDRDCYIDNVIMNSSFEHNGSKYELTGINEPRDSSKDIILYTKHYGNLTETNKYGLEITVVDGKVTTIRAGNSWIPENGYVLSAGALYAEVLSTQVKIGDDIKTVINLIPYSSSIKGRVVELIGGGPRLLKGGMVYISKYEEKFRPDVARGRAARTAVGVTADGKLLVVTVDGRPRRKLKKGEGFSTGMSLTELAYFMQSLGATDALNFDGGGSTTMVINGSVVNRPANGYEQSVSNAIVIKPRSTF
jgi:exopolysaccharide biosynthesis protein